MKRIYVTDIKNPVQLMDHLNLQHLTNAKIAVRSASFEFKGFNLWNNAMFTIVDDKTNTIQKRVIYEAGFYNAKTILDKLKAYASGMASIDELPNGQLWLRIMPGYKLTMTDGLDSLLGYTIHSKRKWILAGEHFSTPVFHGTRYVRLYCEQLDTSDNFLNDQNSNLLASFTLPNEYKFGDMIQYQDSNPYFLPLEPNTYELKLMLTDENHPEKSLKLSNINLEILIDL